MRKHFIISPTFIRSLSLTVFGLLLVAIVVRASHTSTSIGTNTVTGDITGHGLTLSGDGAVNGGDLTTTATSFNLLNATATTINFGGVATTLSIGAATGTTTINNALTVTGALTNTADKSGGRIFISPGDCVYTGTSWTATRADAGNGTLAYQAASGVSQAKAITCDITELRRTTASKGLKLNSFDLVYRITNTALAAHAVAFQKAAFVNNTAPAVSAYSTLTGTPQTATQNNPYATTFTVDSKSFHVTDSESAFIDITFTTGGGAGSQYDFFGILLNVDYNLL